MYNKTIMAHQKTIIRGTNHLKCMGLLDIGVGFVKFMHKKDVTYINIKGKLSIKGDYSIGRGCRFDIDDHAIVEIGQGGYINANTNVIIMHSLTIGDNCAISWNCQLLDEDFHNIRYDGRKSKENKDKGIIIEDDVWIGCAVFIYAGSKISKGSVVAANSVVRNVFDEENVLIAGNPATIIKRNVKWTM
jgi:acetyltransferase-like isoleucine patch superfamily enzyme